MLQGVAFASIDTPLHQHSLLPSRMSLQGFACASGVALLHQSSRASLACPCRASLVPVVLHFCTDIYLPVAQPPPVLQSFMWAERLKERGTGNSAKQAAAAGEAKMALEPDVDVAAVFLARQSEACQQCLPFCVLWAAAYPSAC